MKQIFSKAQRTIGIMQPYFLPYIGYFQLINAVDQFIIYDNIEYTKKGWINRNRIIANGNWEYLTLSVKKDSDYLNINQRYLADSWNKDKLKILNKIDNSYKKAEFFNDVMPMIEDILNYDDKNLFNFIYNSIKLICDFLAIETPLMVSSKLDYNNLLKGQEKVIEICKEVKADVYINSIGGLKLYNKEEFRENNIELIFIESQINSYQQFDNEFLEGLSILDLLMFNDKILIQKWLNNYRLL